MSSGDSGDKLKMYILILEAVPAGFAVLAAAHASLAAHLKFKDSEAVRAWLDGPFFKSVCVVTWQQFAEAKNVEDHVVITESKLGGGEVALAFKPRREWPKSFRFYRLYK